MKREKKNLIFVILCGHYVFRINKHCNIFSVIVFADEVGIGIDLEFRL